MTEAPPVDPPAYRPPPAEAGKARRWLLWLAILTSLIAFGPLISTFTAGAIAQAAGCELNEAGSHVCVIAGHDWGGTLSFLFVLGWLMLLTIWLAPLAIGLWLWWLVAWLRRSRA